MKSKVSRFFKKLWQDESGQGATEYILLLVVVVAVALLFGGRLREIVGAKIDELGGSIGGFNIGQ